ncbi:MAG TPA: DUF2281 domain-containing protein [Candidatus Kapabacteria bacterium]|nr:DUF2281 domain-containing protein [Candidatus Kapabacteria bacterium]HPO61904.1 DUF2281 domain-containing protein [Candidatus Kapabacteria bacterium]
MISDLIEKKVTGMNPRLQMDLLRYIEILTNPKEAGNTSIQQLSFEWEDCLSGLKEEYSSVELQHKSLEWR